MVFRFVFTSTSGAFSSLCFFRDDNCLVLRQKNTGHLEIRSDLFSAVNKGGTINKRRRKKLGFFPQNTYLSAGKMTIHFRWIMRWTIVVKALIFSQINEGDRKTTRNDGKKINRWTEVNAYLSWTFQRTTKSTNQSFNRSMRRAVAGQHSVVLVPL